MKRKSTGDHQRSSGGSRIVAFALSVALVSMFFIFSQAAAAAWSWKLTGSNTLGSVVYSLAYDGARLYGGCSNGNIYENDLDGGPWTQTGSNTIAAQINSLAYDGTRLYAACGDPNGKVFQNDMDGGPWTQTGGNLGTDVAVLTFFGGRLYAGTGGGAVLHLVGGAWVQTGSNTPGANINAFAFDGARLYAGCLDGNVYQNDLTGGAWTQTGGSLGSQVYSLAFDGARLYAACFNGNVYQNDLTGGAWANTGSNTIGASLGCLAYDGARLYASTINGVVYQNDLAGGAWTQTGDDTVGWFINDLAYHDGRLFAGANDGAVHHIRTAYEVTAVVEGKGSADPPSQVVPRGHDATVTIEPDDGYHTASVTDNGAQVNPTPSGTYTIDNVSRNHEVVVRFDSDSSTWYLAEGTSAWGFSTYITIENPNNQECTAEITYNTSNGTVGSPDVALPAMSQTTVNPEAVVPDRDFSTAVVCKEGKTIAVDRTMSWTGTGALSPEAHNSVGVTAPARTWYLPEGSSRWGFETWLLIQNPNSTEATVDVTYMIEDEGPTVVQHKVPADSRKTYSMAEDIGSKDASIQVESDVPVIPERAMYRNDRREGHDSIGTTTAASSYFLAEGTTAWGFTTYVLVQNPQDSETTVTLTYMTNSGPMVQEPFTMPANSRKTIRVNDVLPDRDLSIQVTGSQPIIAERAMYWDNGTGEACHDSIGMDSPHRKFYLPDGGTSDGCETYTLVQNPNSSAVVVEVRYLTPSGDGNVTFTDTVAANSRETYFMAKKVLSGRAAVMVTSRTPGKNIMVERAMYWNDRGAGTDTIGAFWD